jgi:hypothetical protein
VEPDEKNILKHLIIQSYTKTHNVACMQQQPPKKESNPPLLLLLLPSK